MVHRKKAFLLNDTSSNCHHGCSVVMRNIEILLEERGIEINGSTPVGYNWDTPCNRRLLDEADIIIVNGEGTLHHSQPSARELMQVANYVSKNLSKPLVLINSTFQDNDAQIIESARLFDKIYVRETRSKIQLVEKSIECEVVPDLSFYSRFDLSFKSIVRGSVGITDSVYIELSELSYELSRSLDFDYLPTVTFPRVHRRRILQSFCQIVKFYMVRLIRGGLANFGVRQHHHWRRSWYYTRNYERYIQKVANLDFLIVGRYHALCFAFKTLTPFFALKSNSHKIEGLLEDSGLPKCRIIDLRDEASLVSNRSLRKPLSEEEIRKITDYTSGAQKKIVNMFDEIASLL